MVTDLSVGLSVRLVSPANTAAPIEMPFEWTLCTHMCKNG